MKDLHIHIERGPYTVEWIERFIRQAIHMGMDEINLLEHSVRIREFHPAFAEARRYNDYQAHWFAEKEQQARTLLEYQSLIHEIKSRDYPIKVNFGMEVCWFEQHEDFLRSLIDSCDFDYVLGSVHWIDNWTFNQRKHQWQGRDVNKLYRRYYEMNKTLIQSGIFDIVAHPDLIRCHGIYPDYDLTDTYQSFCDAAIRHHVKVELNTSKWLGLNPDFLAIAKQSGVAFSTGSDAHRPEDVGRGIREVTAFVSLR